MHAHAWQAPAQRYGPEACESCEKGCMSGMVGKSGDCIAHLLGLCFVVFLAAGCNGSA